MKQEFMSAAKRVGKFLSVPILAFMMVACGGEATASSESTIAAPTAVTASHSVKKELPFPNYPSKLEGCIASDENTTFAVLENEGMAFFGVHKLIQTPQDGVHGMVMAYSKTKDYGYMLTNKADGQLCVSDTFTDFSFKESAYMTQANTPVAINKEDCGFTQKYSNTCGAYSQLAGALQSKGFSIDWQAVNSKGNVETLLSGNGKSYILTTNAETGATVITGNGKAEFEFFDIPSKNKRSQLIAANL